MKRTHQRDVAAPPISPYGTWPGTGWEAPDAWLRLPPRMTPRWAGRDEDWVTSYARGGI